MIQSGTFWLVLVIAVPLFWALPRGLRPGFLALLSVGYLASFTVRGAVAVTGWSLLFFHAAPLVTRNGLLAKRLLVGLLVAILGFLAAFKYVPPVLAALAGAPLVSRVLAPIGISYYVFKLIHYAIEVRRDTIPAHSLPQFLSYMFLFPTFTAGPIERFDHYLNHQDDRWHLQTALEGGTRIIHGLIKKFVVAEVLLIGLQGEIADGGVLLELLPTLSPARVWGVLLVEYLYIYFDFSAYTDIALGCSRLFGIRIMENFRFPIIANSIGDFWRRWHLSLSSWVQYYIYLPVMAMTRKPYLAALGAFTVIGLWHAGTLLRLSWGLYHFAGVAVFMIWTVLKRKKRWRFFDDRIGWNVAAIVGTQLFVTGSMAFLVVEEHGGLGAGLRVLAKLAFIDLP